MKEQITQRLKDLQAEFKSGQVMLEELETKQSTLRSTLLRISGAIQVLEELLAQADQPEAEANSSVPEMHSISS